MSAFRAFPAHDPEISNFCNRLRGAARGEPANATQKRCRSAYFSSSALNYCACGWSGGNETRYDAIANTWNACPRSNRILPSSRWRFLRPSAGDHPRRLAEPPELLCPQCLYGADDPHLNFRLSASTRSGCRSEMKVSSAMGRQIQLGTLAGDTKEMEQLSNEAVKHTA